MDYSGGDAVFSCLGMKKEGETPLNYNQKKRRLCLFKKKKNNHLYFTCFEFYRGITSGKRQKNKYRSGG
jgi:hypothetical protein